MAIVNNCHGLWRVATYQTLFECGFILNEGTKLLLAAADIDYVHEHHHRAHRGGPLAL